MNTTQDEMAEREPKESSMNIYATSAGNRSFDTGHRRFVWLLGALISCAGCVTPKTPAAMDANACDWSNVTQRTADSFELVEDNAALCKDVLRSANIGGLGAFLGQRTAPWYCAAFKNVDMGIVKKTEEDVDWALLAKVEDYFWRRDVNPPSHLIPEKESSWTGSVEDLERARKGFRARFYREIEDGGYQIGDVDIDNSGDMEAVFYIPGRGGSLGSLVLVLADDRLSIDAEMTEKILQHPPFDRSQPPSFYVDTVGLVRSPLDATVTANYKLFQSTGINYVDFAWRFPGGLDFERDSDTRTARIVHLDSSAVIEDCVLRYKL